jgi:hypothetical protein
MPRLEIETIQDFKILHEIGALTPDMTVKLSRILLGEEPGAAKKRKREGDDDTGLQAAQPFPERQPAADPSRQPADPRQAGRQGDKKPPAKP